MGIQDHSDPDGEFSGDYRLSMFAVIGPFPVLQGPTDLRSEFPDGFGQPNSGDAGVCTQPSRPDVGGRLDQRELAIGRLDAAIEADAQGMSLAGRGFTMPRTQCFGRTIGADK